MTKMSFLGSNSAVLSLAADYQSVPTAGLPAPTPAKQAPIGGGNPDEYLLTLETQKLSLGVGGDVGTGKGGDTGGYSDDFQNVTVGTVNTDATSVDPGWVNTVTTDVDNNQINNATMVLA